MARRAVLIGTIVSLIATCVAAWGERGAAVSAPPGPASGASFAGHVAPRAALGRPVSADTARTSGTAVSDSKEENPETERGSSQAEGARTASAADADFESIEAAGKAKPLLPEIEQMARSLSESADLLPRMVVQPASFRGMMGEMISGAARNTSPQPEARNLPAAEVQKDYCARLVDSGDISSFDIILTSGFFPKGLVLNKTTGELCGAPAESGIFRFTIGLRDFSGARKQLAFRLVVTEAAAAAEETGALVILTAELAVGAVGAEYVQQLEASGGKAPYRWSAAGLPGGMEIDEASGLLGGSAADPGEFEITVTAADAETRVAAEQFTLVIRTTPVFITTQDLGDATAGELFQVRLAAQGGVPPYFWELIGSELPEGLELNAESGTIEGTPRGEFQGLLTFRVRDSEESSDAADIPLVVHASTLRIVTRALADGFAEENYAFVLRAEGGTPPYVWSAGGELPEGLALAPNGRVSGAPLRAGEHTLRVTVRDSMENESARTLRIRIEELQPAEPEATPSPVEELPTDDSGSAGPTPTPSPPLPSVTDFTAVPSDKKVGLSWVNPVHAQFVRTAIVRTEGAAAASVLEGTLVYSGSDTQALDLDVENSKTYLYSAFAEFSADAAEEPAVAATASVMPETPRVDGSPDPFIDRARSFSPLDRGCFNCPAFGSIILGPPQGAGEFTGSGHVVSIGSKVNNDAGRSEPYGGSILVEFTDNIVVDGPGADFILFENALRLIGTDDYFIEPATVDVSADGIRFYRFPTDFIPHYRADGTLNLWNPFSYAAGFGGVRPVYSNRNFPSPLKPSLAGGDAFDLGDLPGAPLRWIRFIRITSTGDGWLTDRDGDVIRHSNSNPTFGASGLGNSGFDLDAAAAVNY